MPKNKKCQFKIESPLKYACHEPAFKGSKYCIFHKPNKTEQEAELFKHRLKEKLLNKDCNFTGYFFPERVNLDGQVFDKDADFTKSTFEGEVSFVGSTFKGGADFVISIFKGDARFSRVKFKAGASFSTSTFEKDAFLQRAIFNRIAWFSDSMFKRDANFSRSTFEGVAVFRRAIFEKDAYFQRTMFESIVDLKDATFRDNASAERLFRSVKNSYQIQGDYTLAGEYYYKERIARRKQLPSYSPKRWLEYIFFDGLCGYGERPLRAIRTGLGVLFGLAFLYWRVGHIYPSPELFNEPHTLTFLDALYFSVVTFTTLGFGDWRPDPSHWIRYIVMSEAFIGAFLMALFIVTFARRMMR